MLAASLVMAGCLQAVSSSATPETKVDPVQTAAVQAADVTATPAATAAPIPESGEIVVLGETEGYPEGCGPRAVADLAVRFFEAFSADDPTPIFDNFDDITFNDTLRDSQDGAVFFETSDRTGLLSYKAGRRAQEERLSPRLIQVSGPGWHGGMDVAFVYSRRALDLTIPPGQTERVGIGKGVVGCPAKKIYLWVMTTEPAAAGLDATLESWLRRSCAGGAVPDGSSSALIVCAGQRAEP